jgi:hypothetical protein
MPDPAKHVPGDFPGCCDDSDGIVVWRQGSYARGPGHEGWTIGVADWADAIHYEPVRFCPFCGKELPS